jgi:hypothetical protein
VVAQTISGGCFLTALVRSAPALRPRPQIMLQ